MQKLRKKKKHIFKSKLNSGQEINTEGGYYFYCKNLWSLSYLLANSMDATLRDFANNPDSEDNTKVFLQPSEKIFDLNFGNFSPIEFQNLILYLPFYNHNVY